MEVIKPVERAAAIAAIVQTKPKRAEAPKTGRLVTVPTPRAPQAYDNVAAVPMPNPRANKLVVTASLDASIVTPSVVSLAAKTVQKKPVQKKMV